VAAGGGWHLRSIPDRGRSSAFDVCAIDALGMAGMLSTSALIRSAVRRASAIRLGAVSREANGGHQEGGLEPRQLLASAAVP